jgi:hypothetical protein
MVATNATQHGCTTEERGSMIKMMIGAAALATVLLSVNEWHQKHPRAMGERKRLSWSELLTPPTRTPASTGAATTVTGGTQPSATTAYAPLPEAATADEAAQQDALRIVRTAERYQVPEGVLFAIWMLESRGLRTGWAESKRWVPAHTLRTADSKCSEHYDHPRCERRWQMIRALCNQQVNGAPMCDPNAVRVTYGMAMGPLQHMPNVLLIPRDEGGYRWNDHAVDADGDGVRNPFDIDDALAMTALELRKRHAKAVKRGEADPWRDAVIRYSGEGNDPYFEGGTGAGQQQAGARHYWQAWQQCRTRGDCPAEIVRLRSR